jgi:hypothetical protein
MRYGHRGPIAFDESDVMEMVLLATHHSVTTPRGVVRNFVLRGGGGMRTGSNRACEIPR